MNLLHISFKSERSNGSRYKNNATDKEIWLFNVVGQYVQRLLDAILSLSALAIIKNPGHSDLDSLEAKGNPFADTSTRNAVFKETSSSQISVMGQRDIS